VANYGLDLDPYRLSELTKLDSVEHIETLMELGIAYARDNLKAEHFKGFIRLRL
jgi:hypothetical protein